MAIRVTWDDAEKTRMYYSFDRDWTWEEFFEAKAEAYQMIDNVPHGVGIIMDLPADMWIPAKLLVQGRKALSDRHTRTRMIVFVVNSYVLRTMLNAFMRFAAGITAHLYMASNADEAREIIMQRLTTIEAES